MLSLRVIIPIVDRKRADVVLSGLEAQKNVWPDKVLIIDNTPDLERYTFKTDRFRVKTFKPLPVLGVNASWNWGLTFIGNCDFVSILNDDIMVRPRFVEYILVVFEQFPDCGVACPVTITDLQQFETYFTEAPSRYMSRREGWAFTGRKKAVFDKIPPIPEELETFCGDDWFWRGTYKLGYKWVKDGSNIIYHAVGASIRLRSKVRDRLKEEKRRFNTLVKTMEVK